MASLTQPSPLPSNTNRTTQHVCADHSARADPIDLTFTTPPPTPGRKHPHPRLLTDGEIDICRFGGLSSSMALTRRSQAPLEAVGRPSPISEPLTSGHFLGHAHNKQGRAFPPAQPECIPAQEEGSADAGGRGRGHSGHPGPGQGRSSSALCDLQEPPPKPALSSPESPHCPARRPF